MRQLPDKETKNENQGPLAGPATLEPPFFRGGSENKSSASPALNKKTTVDLLEEEKRWKGSAGQPKEKK